MFRDAYSVVQRYEHNTIGGAAVALFEERSWRILRFVVPREPTSVDTNEDGVLLPYVPPV